MKIFNWVHRRFNNKEHANKNCDIGAAGEKQEFELVENKCNVFERWRGGILTIGTFGYDPLKDESEQINDVCNYRYEEDEEFEKSQQVLSAENQSHDEISDSELDESENGDEEEENPLVFAAYHDDAQGLMELEMEANRMEEFGFEYMMMEKKARTTLADLFYADSEDMKKQPLKKFKGEIAKEKLSCRHARFSFHKKLILEDARPIHKLHQLMRRMLKRKIHPDIGPVYSKVSVVKKCEINDHASLLPTQARDAII